MLEAASFGSTGASGPTGESGPTGGTGPTGGATLTGTPTLYFATDLASHGQLEDTVAVAKPGHMSAWWWFVIGALTTLALVGSALIRRRITQRER